MGDAPAAAAAAAAVASPAGKRRRGDEGAGMRRVAEIVMVLAAAGEVRGGREPTPAERALVAEARERLAGALAEGAVRPKDLFPVEAVRAVVEDLGLSRIKDPAVMGLRPPKASIADRLMLTKRKMEEVKEAPPQSTVSTSQTVVSSGMSEFHSLNGASKFGVGVPRNPSAPAALAATAPLTSASPVIYKPPGSSPAKPAANSSVATPHAGPSHLNKLDKDVNGPLNLARSAGAATMVHSNKSTLDTSARSNVNAEQSSNQVGKNQDTKLLTGNTVVGLRATPGVAFVSPKPTFANHNEIAKTVQQFLHQPTNHPSWTPPSTEYMHSALGCQICKISITDADSLLVCDACEKGVHLKCLQQYGNKGVPKAEWHCSACLTRSKGGTLPPKYGKVTRTPPPPKAAPPTGGAQLPLQGSAENVAAKVNHQRLAANGNLMKPIATQAGSTIHSSNVLALSAITASSQSQLVSTLRPSLGDPVKIETSSEKDGSGQQCSSMIQHDMKSPLSKGLRSAVSSNCANSTNGTINGNQTTEISGAEAKIKSEVNSEPPACRDEEMVDSSGTSTEQTKIVVTEQKPKAQTTFETDKLKDGETTSNTGTSKDQGSNFATEEKQLSETTSEALSVNDVEMTNISGITIQQSSSAAIEEKLRTDTASEPHNIEDMEMLTDNVLSIDQSSIFVTEEKAQAEPTSSIAEVDITANAEISTDQPQPSNGLIENGVIKPPKGDACEDNSGCNAVPDQICTQKVTLNGFLHRKDEALCGHENEIMGSSAEEKVEPN